MMLRASPLVLHIHFINRIKSFHSRTFATVRKVREADRGIRNGFEDAGVGDAAKISYNVQSEQLGILATGEYDACGSSCQAKS